MPRNDFKGLENQLRGVLVGTLITLITEQGDRVTGYVTDYNPRTVKLSLESPNNNLGRLAVESDDNDSISELVRKRSREKTYPLCKFTKYKIRGTTKD